MLFDPSNPQALWLDVTDAGLRVLCLVCLLAIGWGVVRELAYRSRQMTMGHDQRTRPTFTASQPAAVTARTT